MKSAKDIERLVGHAGLRSRPEVNEAVLDDLRKQLVADEQGGVARARSRSRGQIARDHVMQTAIAAAVIVAVGLVVITHSPRRTQPQPLPNPMVSAADMLTVGHLNTAYRRGGMNEVERQCEQAEVLMIRPERISANELIRELEGT